jgi:ribosomal small subunit protein bTHX
MGKGDIKSKKGKIASGSFGKKRKQRNPKKAAIVAKPTKTKNLMEASSEADVKKTKKTTKRTAKKTDESSSEE